MAKLERGKGKHKQIITIARRGALLEQRQSEGEHHHLTGYRQCESAEHAARELAREVQGLLLDGMRPADDEARELVPASPKEKPPSAPLRRDIAVFNEANGFVITSRRMAGKTLEEGSAAWRKAVTKGDLIPISLTQDDPFIVRVVLGDALSPAEEAASKARIDAALDVRDGKLCITGGAVFAEDGYDPDDPHHEQYVAELPVPKGRYQAAIHVLVRPQDSEAEHVDFLVHLSAPDAARAATPTALSRDGWFSGKENACVASGPAIVASDVARRDADDCDWLFVHEPFADLAGCTPADLGDTLEVGVDALAHAARLAWLASSHARLELRIERSADAPTAPAIAWPKEVVITDDSGVTRVLFEADATIDGCVAAVTSLAPFLQTMTSGGVLHLCAAARAPGVDEPSEAGALWLRGPIEAGRWTITAAYPRVDRGTLAEALELAAEVNGGLAIAHALDAFRDSFGEVWPMADDHDLRDDEEEPPAKPIVGAKIVQTAGGRSWFQTMALLISEEVAANVQAAERDLRRSGYRHIGDLLCDACDTIALRAYLRPDGHDIAVIRASAPDRAELEIVTRFADGTVLTSSREAGRTLPERLHQQLIGATTGTLVTSHDERRAALAARHGAPLATEPKLQPLAEILDSALFTAD